MTKSRPDLVLFVFDHGTPMALEWDISAAMHEFFLCVGEDDALADAIERDLEPGSYVAELELVDDGLGDYEPGECSLTMVSVHRATADEWAAYVRGEWLWYDNEDDGRCHGGRGS